MSTFAEAFSHCFARSEITVDFSNLDHKAYQLAGAARDLNRSTSAAPTSHRYITNLEDTLAPAPYGHQPLQISLERTLAPAQHRIQPRRIQGPKDPHPSSMLAPAPYGHQPVQMPGITYPRLPLVLAHSPPSPAELFMDLVTILLVLLCYAFFRREQHRRRVTRALVFDAIRALREIQWDIEVSNERLDDVGRELKILKHRMSSRAEEGEWEDYSSDDYWRDGVHGGQEDLEPEVRGERLCDILAMDENVGSDDGLDLAPMRPWQPRQPERLCDILEEYGSDDGQDDEGFDSEYAQDEDDSESQVGSDSASNTPSSETSDTSDSDIDPGMGLMLRVV